jgi:4-hydroxybenzoate polyprenyltransferase
MFLGILVLAPKKNASPVEYLSGFADWGVWIGFAVLTAFTLPGLISDIIKQRGDTRRSYLLGLFRNRVNFTRLLSLLCVIPAAVTVSISKSPHALAARQYRAELAFYVYVLCIVFCLIIELMYNVGQGRKRWRVKDAARNIVGFLFLIRIVTSSAIALVVILPLLHEGSSITRSFLAAMPFFLAAAGGFALNDYYDAEKDRINKPYRALPSGRINPGVVKSIAFTLIGSASLAAILVSHNTFQLALYGFSILGVTFYNYLVKHITLSKSIVTALVSTLPLLYVVVTLDYPKTYFFIPASSLVFLIGREWLMDVRDIVGDATAGIETLPISIGSMWTAILSFSFFFGSFALLVPYVVTIHSWWAIGFLLVMIGSTVILAILWWAKCGSHRRAVVLGLWVPMSCGILMLIR